LERKTEMSELEVNPKPVIVITDLRTGDDEVGVNE
jgi:hypothetical protein